MRQFRLTGVKRSKFGYREHGPVVLVYAKHGRQARQIAALRLTKEKERNTSPWINSSVTSCAKVPHAHCRGKVLGAMTVGG